jgi:transporter family-2 protein
MDGIIFILACLGAGGLLAVQAGANAQLSKAVGSPFAATTLQLLVAAVLLALVAAAMGDLAAVWKLRDVTWWHALGGTASAFYVVSTILLFPRLGAVVSIGLFIAGQMLASLALDGFGLLGVPPKEIAMSTLVGIFAVLAGAAAIVMGQSGGLDSLAPRKLGWISLALVAGAVLPLQGAVNALLRDGMGEPLAVGTVSFVVATVAMVLTLLITTTVTGQHRRGWQALLGCPGGRGSAASPVQRT